MIERRNEETENEATEIYFYDKELADANANKDEREILIKKFTTKQHML